MAQGGGPRRHYPESPRAGDAARLRALAAAGNLSLPEGFDRGLEATVKPRRKGRASRLRYADDAVLTVACEEEARRVREILPKRLGKYGLTVHPDKTRVLRCAPPLRRATAAEPRAGDTAHSVEFLGLTPYGGKSRPGRWVVKRQTAAGRFGRTRQRRAHWGRVNRHQPVVRQPQHLSAQLRGQDAYYGITGKGPALRRLRYEGARVWQQGLNRRSHRAAMPWERLQKLLDRYPLPPPVLYHSVYRPVANPCA